MRKRILLIISFVIIISFLWTWIALASEEGGAKDIPDPRAVIEKSTQEKSFESEPSEEISEEVEVKEGESESTEEKVEEESEKGKEGEEKIEAENGEGEAEGEEGKEGEGEEKEPEDFREIFGWQTPFTLLALLYFITIPLNLLPKIAAKDLEDHH